MLDGLKWRLKPFVERNLFLQRVGMWAFRNLPLLLPHDADYYALRHFHALPGSMALFLDVGANTGLSALSFRRFDRTTPILSLEPNPSHLPSLERIARSDSGFRFLLVAAGEEEGELRLHVPAVGSYVLHTMASLSAEELAASCQRVLTTTQRRRLRILMFQVPVRRIDSLGLRPSIVKIDAEGSEAAILAGGMETIRQSRPFIMLENNEHNQDDCADLLRDVAYERLVYERATDAFRRGLTIGRNVFFVPSERAGELPILSAG